MVVCSSEHQDVPEERLDEMPLSRRKEMAKKYIWNHGSTSFLTRCLLMAS
jgi:hypothetical protein